MKRGTVLAVIGVIVLAVVVLVLYSLYTKAEVKLLDDRAIHRKLDTGEVETVAMTRFFLEDNVVKQGSVDLSHDQRNAIVAWFNDIPAVSAEQAIRPSPMVRADIRITLRSGGAVSIQLVAEELFVIRSDRKGTAESVSYRVKSEPLKAFFLTYT